MLDANISPQVQTMSALKWLLDYKVFDHVPTWGTVSYNALADSAKAPVPELKRMLRMVIASHIFSEVEGDMVRHNAFSRILARDEYFLRGLPFYYNTVIPASTKATGTADSEETDEVVSNLAPEQASSSTQSPGQSTHADGYYNLIGLLGDKRILQAVYSAQILHGVNWTFLNRRALIVDVGDFLITADCYNN